MLLKTYFEKVSEDANDILEDICDDGEKRFWLCQIDSRVFQEYFKSV